jgi:hypothetical protein
MIFRFALEKCCICAEAMALLLLKGRHIPAVPLRGDAELHRCVQLTHLV